MGISIPNICDANYVTNAHRSHKQTNQTDGTITVQCKVNTFFFSIVGTKIELFDLHDYYGIQHRHCFVEAMIANNTLHKGMYHIMQEWYEYIDKNIHIQADLIGKHGSNFIRFSIILIIFVKILKVFKHSIISLF